MPAEDLIAEKIQVIKEEMKSAGLWKKEIPEWVNDFQTRLIGTDHDFSDWLQFVYLPNILEQAGNKQAIIKKKNVVPDAVKYYGEDVKKGKLLQLLIELDSLA